MISAPAAFPCILLYIVAVAGPSLPACHGQTGHQPPSAERLLRSVAEYEKSVGIKVPEPSQCMYTFVQLASQNRPEAVVYLTGGGWCGTGGCTTLILTANAFGYKVISQIPATRLPIRLLRAKSHGWHDLAVRRLGDGFAYEERLVFDGLGYWFSSSDDTGRSAVGREEGKVILSSKNTEVSIHP